MIYVVIISILFGISQKLADALNEHGTILFKRANIFFGIIFGITGSLLISINSSFTCFYLGLVIYWLVAGKLDYPNHQLSGSLMIITAIKSVNESKIAIENIVFVIFVFLLFKIIKNYLADVNVMFTRIFDKKMHHFLIATIIGLWFSNYLISISIILTLISIIITIQTLKHLNNYKF